MKKFLSLVLALIMVMSLVTVGAGAVEFADAEDIQYNEAVEVMTSLGILSGYENGYFAPNGTLSRGAAAKIAAYVALGNGAAMLDADEVSFPDVSATSSMAPYIAWAAENEIVNGYTNGNFGPKATVSGYAFLKMMLNVLGIEGTYTGTGWQVAVAAAAEDAELFEGIDTDEYNFKEAASRELAAQIAFNAMKYVPEGNTSYFVGAVEFDNMQDAAIYAALVQGTVTPKTDLTKSLAGKNYKLACDTVCIASTPETADQTTTKSTKGTAYSVSASKELVGHMVNVYYKDADGDQAYDAKEVVYTVVDKSTEVTTKKKTGLTADEVEALLGIEDVADAEEGFVAMASDDTVTNYAHSTAAKTNLVKYEAKYEGLTVAAGTYIIYNETILAYKSSSTSVDVYTITIDSTKNGYYTVKNGATTVVKVAADEDDCVDLDKSDVDWVSLVEDGKKTAKVVFVTEKTGAFYTVSEVETVTGTVTKNDISGDTDYIYIDGTKYTVKTGLTAAAEVLEATTMAADTPVAFDEYVFYLDGDGKVFAYDTVDGSVVTDGSVIVPVYVYVKTVEVEAEEDEYGDVTNLDDAGLWYSTWIQCVDVNGEIVNLQVKDSSKTEQKKDDYKVDTAKFYTYTTEENEDGEVIATLTKVASGDAEESQNKVAADQAAALSSSSKKVNAGVNTYYLNDDYKVIYISGTGSDIEITVKDGTYDQIVAGAYVYGAKDEDASAYELKFVVVNKAVSTDVAGADLIYVNADLTTKVSVSYVDDDETKTAYENTVYINGEEKTIITTAAEANAAKVGFYKYTVNDLGLYDLTKVEEDVVVNTKIDSIYKGMITIAAAGMDDVDVSNAILVNLVDDEAEGYEEITTDATALTDEYTLSIIWDSEDEVAEIIYITKYEPAAE